MCLELVHEPLKPSLSYNLNNNSTQRLRSHNPVPAFGTLRYQHKLQADQARRAWRPRV